MRFSTTFGKSIYAMSQIAHKIAMEQETLKPLIAPWSFYSIVQCKAEHDDTAVTIAEAMTTPGVQVLPRGCIKRAYSLLKDMKAAGLDSGSGYARLLLLALASEPSYSSLVRLSHHLIAQYFSSGQIAKGTELYEALPRDTQTQVGLKLSAPVMVEAVRLFSFDDLSASLAVAGRYSCLPQLQAFARLPALCAATPETLPNADDAPMLRALFRQPKIGGAVRSEVVDRLFERVGKGLPHDLELARLRQKRFRAANRLGQALKISRQIRQHPDSSISDLVNRVDILARLDRLDVINRYVRSLERIHAAGGCSDLELASRLWAAGFPVKALAVLGSAEHYIASSAHVDVALRALYRLRRFGEAQTLMEQAQQDAGTSVNKSVAKQIDRACAYLSKRGIQPVEREDNSLGVVRDIVNNVLRVTRYAYDPVPRRVMITTHSIAIGGAERQVTGQAVGLAREPDVESVMILANRDSEVTYEVPNIDGKLKVRCARQTEPGTTTFSVDGIDLGEVSANFGLVSLCRFYNEIIAFRPEVVHVRSGQHIEVALAALLAGTPKVVVHFGSMTRGQQSLGNDVSRLREVLLEQGLAIAARIPNLRLVANSRSAANNWADAMGLKRSAIGLVTNCIDACVFSHARVEADHDELVVGGVFRFAPVKDPLMWVEVAAELAQRRPRTRFIMVGDGPMRAAVEMSIDKRGLRNRFVLPGLVTSGVASWLARMDVFLMTSRTESLPNSVIEAQLMGLPVVAPEVGGISEVFATPTSGRVCERNITALTEAIVAYLDRPDLRAQIRKEAPASIMRKFSAARQIADVRAAYDWPPVPAKQSSKLENERTQCAY